MKHHADNAIRHVDWWKNAHHDTSLRYSNGYESTYGKDGVNHTSATSRSPILVAEHSSGNNRPPARFRSFNIGRCLKEEDWW